MPCAAQSFPSAETLAQDKGSDLLIRQCDDCGLVQLAGEPVPYYREVIRATAFSPEMGKFRCEQFRDWCTTYGLGGQAVLEVGCGRGEYLHLLRQAGMNARGIEYGPAAVASCRKADLPVQRRFPEKLGQSFHGGPFAAFVSLNFMEHWPRPLATLRAIRDNLEPGGLGFVEVPNFDMIIGRKLYSEFISDHLSYFTRQTLSLTLQMAGFDLLECRAVWHDYILSAVVRKRAPLDVSSLTRQQDAMTGLLRSFVARFPHGQVAVWGAGHQALAAIALAGIAGNLRYIVDSAPFKQGKYTPATHLPIFAPEQLRHTPVQAVVVMAASYSDEVVGLLRKHYPYITEIAILRNDRLELA